MPTPTSDGPGSQPTNLVPSTAQPSYPIRESLQPTCTGVGMGLDVETIEPKRIRREFVYSAKFLCGKIPHSPADPQDPPAGFPLVPGTYRTAINVHNPNMEEVTFTKTAVTTNPERQPRGRAGKHEHETLAPGEGLEIDCQDIEALLTTGSGIDLYNNWNVEYVYSDPNGPPAATVFWLNDPTMILEIDTYHWNNAAGDAPGTISLQDQSGNSYGPYPATGTPGQGGVQNANWIAYPNVFLQPGFYTVVDSNRSSWSYNQNSGMAGFAAVRGAPSFVGRTPFFKGFVVIRSPELLDVVGVYTVKNVIAAAPRPPQPPDQGCGTISISVTLDPFQTEYHLFQTIHIVADISGGTPPYNPVVVTLQWKGQMAPYPLTGIPGSTAASPYKADWQVYLRGPLSPGTWGKLEDCTISVAVTDARGCKGTGTTTQTFTLWNPEA